MSSDNVHVLTSDAKWVWKNKGYSQYMDLVENRNLGDIESYVRHFGVPEKYKGGLDYSEYGIETIAHTLTEEDLEFLEFLTYDNLEEAKSQRVLYEIVKQDFEEEL